MLENDGATLLDDELVIDGDELSDAVEAGDCDALAEMAAEDDDGAL